MASKRYVLRKVVSNAIGRELPDERIVSLVVNANEKTFIRNDSDRVEAQSTGSIARRVEELLRGDEVLGAEDVSAIKAALEAANHPTEIEPEIDFEYVSATLHEALSLIARSVRRRKRTRISLACPLPRARPARYLRRGGRLLRSSRVQWLFF